MKRENIEKEGAMSKRMVKIMFVLAVVLGVAVPGAEAQVKCEARLDRLMASDGKG